MRGSLRLHWHKPRVNLCSYHLISINRSMHFNIHTCSKTPISNTTSRTNTHHNNYTLREGVAETLEDEMVEKDLVGEEV